MKVGTLAYATHQGLGILAKGLYDAKIISDVFIVHHSSRPTYPEWFPTTTRENQASIKEITGLKVVKQFCESMDVMFFLETPFDWSLIPYCKSKGVKTVLMPMYECVPKRLPYQPDRFINPSMLDQRYYPERSTFLTVPSPQEWRLREKAMTFVHNAGHGGLKGRNGTRELLEAILLADCFKGRGNAQLIIRSQEPLQDPPFRGDLAGRVKWITGTVPANELYRDGDVFIFPEKFNGLSLPIQEAYAAGMMVMCLNRFPMNDWLPREPLIPVHAMKPDQCVSPRCNLFNEAVADPVLIAKTMDYWYGKDITGFSRMGKAWAQANTWEALRPKYMEELSK